MTDFDSEMVKLRRRIAGLETMVIAHEAAQKREKYLITEDEDGAHATVSFKRLMDSFSDWRSQVDQKIAAMAGEPGLVQFRQACADLSEWRKNVTEEFEGIRAMVAKMKETVDGLVDDLTKPETPKDADGYPADEG